MNTETVVRRVRHRESWLRVGPQPYELNFRRIILGCVRAVDFLAKHPTCDGKRMVVQGGSQGGFLAMATEALEQRVQNNAFGYPANCDVACYLHDRAGDGRCGEVVALRCLIEKMEP